MHVEISPLIQIILAGLLVGASASLLMRAVVFLSRERSGMRPVYPRTWSKAQCRLLEKFRLLVGLALISLWGAFLSIVPAVQTKWSFGDELLIAFVILLLLKSNAWMLLLLPRNWEKFGALSRSFSIVITFLFVWWGVAFTATSWLFAKASASSQLHSVSGVYAELGHGYFERAVAANRS
jgi:hypothetical protein